MFFSLLWAVLKSMRPKQWAKNGFLFAALIFDGKLFAPPELMRTVAGFILFCVFSGTVYIINDINDLEADRMHPSKRNRPIAAGQLSLRAARIVVALFLLVGLPLAYRESIGFATLALAYMLLNLAYTKWFKHISILDVMVLASFYVIRVGAGVELIEVSRFSPWLYVFTSFLALFLGVGKRRAELSLLEGEADAHRKVLGGYTIPLLDQLMGIVSSMTIITYSLYTFSAPNLPENHTMMLTIPFVIYGVFRYLYLMQIKQSGGAPEDVLFNDWGMQLSLLGFGLAILIIFYLL